MLALIKLPHYRKVAIGYNLSFGNLGSSDDICERNCSPHLFNQLHPSVFKEHVSHVNWHFRLAILRRCVNFEVTEDDFKRNIWVCLYIQDWLPRNLASPTPFHSTTYGLSVDWRGDLCLLCMPRLPEGANHSTLRTLVLPGLYPDPLGQEGQHRSVQLPPMQAGLQPSTLSG